jgi:uncharacterized protein YdaU (DUF1376 family)
MAGIPYIKFYASDWRAGTTNTLTLDEEGLYIRACVYMWATGEPVPGNDRLAAKALCVQPLRYEKLMAGLIAKGKMIRGQGSVFNERVMEDLAEYRAEQARNSSRTQKGWDRRRAALTQNVELAEAVAAIKSPTPHHTPPHTGGVTAPVADGKHNDYNDRVLQEQCQPEARIQNPEKKDTKQRSNTTPTAAPLSLDELENKLLDACNGALANPCNSQGLLNLAIPQMWLTGGADLELDVIPTLRAIGKRDHGKGIASWSYFTKAVADTAARRKAGMPAGHIGKPEKPFRPSRLGRFSR